MRFPTSPSSSSMMDLFFRVAGMMMSTSDFCMVHYYIDSGIMEFGKDWKEVEKIVKTRTGSQVRSHAQKYFIKLHNLQKERKRHKSKISPEPTRI